MVQDLKSVSVEETTGMTSFVDKPEQNGCTPLLLACQNGHKDIAEYLLKLGASADTIASKGADKETILHWAALNGHIDVCKLLLAYGANALAGDAHGLTPENYAPVENLVEVVGLFRSLLRQEDDVLEPT